MNSHQPKTNETTIKPVNQFSKSEWSGAFGDLGTLVPLAFALIIFNGFPPARLLFLWGIIYIATGYFFKVPISVQPLKAMSVIAIASEIPASDLSTTAFFYGILLVILSYTGIIKWLQKLFSNTIVKGIQLGVGLILAKKAIQLLGTKGLLLHFEFNNIFLNLLLFSFLLVLFWFVQFKKKFPLSLFLIVSSIATILIFYPNINLVQSNENPILFSLPKLNFLANAIVILIIPQLPLTLGNAVFAASDITHTLMKKQASNVTPKKLCASIGLSNIFIGLAGGFPICHGSGGIAAHSQFGGKTGGTTIILGIILVILGIYPPFASVIFLIPVPILASMLFYDSFRMCTFVLNLVNIKEITIASIVGLVSFFTKNLTIALVIGILAEFIINKIIIFKTEKKTV